MKEQIINLLSEKDTISLPLKSIAKKLGISNTTVLNQELQEMVDDGTLYYSPKSEKYLLIENSHLIKARIVTNKYNEGFINYNGEEITIPANKMNGAVYGDIVIVDYDKAWRVGSVFKVIKHDDSKFVGEVVKRGQKLYAYHPKRGYLLIDPSNNFYTSLVEGERIVVYNKDNMACVTEVIGHKDDPGIDIKSILIDYGFGKTWSSAALTQLESIPSSLTEEDIEKELSQGRIDLRDKQIVTMDCDDTKDIDDGFIIEPLPDGSLKLTVLIAEVSKYIPLNSPIDIEARNVTTSVYPPGAVEPMLHHKISNGICSLNPLEDRFAMAYSVTITKDFEFTDFTPFMAIINSKAKMKYSDVNKILEEDIMVSGYQDYYKLLLYAQKVALNIEKRMKKNGYLDFYAREAKPVLNEYNQTVSISTRKNGTAEKIIEFLMLQINCEITKFLVENNIPYIFRIDGRPNQVELRKVFTVANHLGYIDKSELKHNYEAKDIQRLIRSVTSTPHEEVINKMLIRCMDKARYSISNIGHYPLGFEYYGQNTSPIRRYNDFINQKILKHYLRYGRKSTCMKYNKKFLSSITSYCSERELAAKKCEREAVETKIIELMSSHVKESYHAIISSIDDYGIYAILDNTLEVFIKKSELPGDKYKFLASSYTLHGSKYDFSIGDEVTLKLTYADKLTRVTRFKVQEINKKSIQIPKKEENTKYTNKVNQKVKKRSRSRI